MRRSTRRTASSSPQTVQDENSSRDVGSNTEQEFNSAVEGSDVPSASYVTTESIIAYLRKPHTITILIAMLSVFLYVALYVTETGDTVRNTKLGILASALVLTVLGLLMFGDGPFIRPHPALWRLVLAASAVYQLFLVFLLFQNVSDAQQLFKYWDSDLGVKLPERSYADNCELSWENVSDQLDEFVIAHTLGWFGKAIIIRDYWLGWVLSVMFEVLEYSLQHQLPNFAECWWDHWILDVLICNGIGLWMGMKFCQYLEMKQYSWRGIRQIPTYSGKVKRAVQQFTPYSWTKFDWEATKNFQHFAVVVGLTVIFLQTELNAFYLKYLLWIPPANPLNTYRLLFMFFATIPAVRELYQYVTDPSCKRLGAHAWLTIANIQLETLICLKFGKNEFKEPAPWHVKVFWSVFMMLLGLFTLWQFVIEPYLSRRSQEAVTRVTKKRSE